MCLIIMDNKLTTRKSRTEKTYYKVLLKSDFVLKGSLADQPTKGPERKETFYYTPYHKFFVELGKEYEIIDKVEWEVWPSFLNLHVMYLEGGCFHLFERKKDAAEEARLLPDSVVVRAIVPAGTEYVKGLYGDAHSIAVRKVRYEKI